MNGEGVCDVRRLKDAHNLFKHITLDNFYPMEEEKKNNRSLFRLVLMVVLTGFVCFSFYQLNMNYRNLEKSHEIILALLEHETAIANKYSEELGQYKDKLEQTEVMLTQARRESDQLREKTKLLDKMPDLERTIAELQAKNAQMAELAKAETDPTTKIRDLRTVEEGRSMLAKYRYYLSEIKERLHDLRWVKRQERIAIQKEQDRMATMLGNNGYLVRDGEPTPVEIPMVPPGKNINIEVQIVR